MAVSVTCYGCGDTFQAKRSSAKWCSESCRKSAARKPAAEVPETPATPPPDDDREPTGLVASVTAELTKAKALHTFPGQLALELARRLTTPDETGISSLAAQLRAVMAEALGSTPPADPGAGEKPTEDEDEVTRARNARAQARQAAGLA